MIKRILLSIAIIALLASCSASAPNDVTLTTTPGVCVNSVKPGYEAVPTTYSSAFAMNSYMPASSPYCMAVTMTNNNNGTNSNNIQVYQGGLTLTYVAAGTSYSAYMVDFNAAGLNQGNFNYVPVQQLGNIALFDPNNCVTTIGANVQTLNKGGGQCTFYLQLVNESMPTGDYPLNLSINYTNGNQNYNVQANIYQHATMYIGGAFTSPSQYISSFNANLSNAALPFAASVTPASPVELMARDGIGNVYAYDGSSIYMFNGESIVQMSGIPSGINQLTGDSFGNLFAATSSGLYVYNAANGSSATWTQPITGVVINAIQAESINQQNVLYITGANGVESCVYSAGTCAPTTIFSGNNYNNSALGYNPATAGLYWATSDSVFNNSTTPLVLSSGTLSESGPLGVDPLGFVYVANNGSTIESQAVYSNLINGQLSPLADNGSNSIFGTANGVLLRNYTSGSTTAFTLYSYGSNLASLGMPFSGAYLTYMNMVVGTTTTTPSIYTASSAWTPVTGLNGAVNAVVVSSRLANN